VVSWLVKDVVFISTGCRAETRTVKCDGRYHRAGMSWAVRRVFAALATAVVISAITSPVIVAQTDDDAAQQAAAEIVAARERANSAAEAFIAAESKQALLELDRDRLAEEVAALEVEVDKLEEAVETVAVDRFVGSGVDGIPILTDLREPSAQLQANVFAQVVADTGATTIDDYDQAKERLAQKRTELNESERAIERSKQQLVQLQAAAEAEVERLRAIESKRLEDESVAAAVAAQQTEKARQLSEVERRMAESARNAAPTVGVQPPAAVTADSSEGVTSGNIGASGGEAGGRTGGGGTGTNPRAAGEGYIDAIICPLQGSAYGDSWGAPRSGGRRHQGVDMLAPTGSPLIAVVSGYVNQTTNPLGGVALQLFGDNGTRYYFAHLSAYEGLSGWVPQGQVIGYVGDSGNAVGIPHLHFEIHPGGGLPVNPYLSVLSAGC
jgi:murein DD-endopeptidase MepM/ murein hydrolase activator NlpD